MDVNLLLRFHKVKTMRFHKCISVVQALRLLFSLKPKEMAKMRFLAIWIDQK